MKRFYFCAEIENQEMGKWWNRLFSCGKVKYWKDLKIIKCKNGELINFNVKKKWILENKRDKLISTKRKEKINFNTDNFGERESERRKVEKKI